MSRRSRYGKQNPSAIRSAKAERQRQATATFPSTIFLRSADPPTPPRLIAEYGSGNPTAGCHVHFLQPHSPGVATPYAATTVGGSLFFAHTDAEEHAVTDALRRSDLQAAQRAAHPANPV